MPALDAFNNERADIFCWLKQMREFRLNTYMVAVFCHFVNHVFSLY